MAKIRALPLAEAARALPVCFEATVIYFDPLSCDLFVQDDTACTYVASQLPEILSLRSMPLKPGDRVRLEATTKAGGFFPDLMLKRIDRIGKGSFPKPRLISEDELLSPALDSQWVEVPAVVTGVESDDKTFTLAIEVHGWKLKARIPINEHNAANAAALMQRPVRLQGVAGTLFNPQRQMAGRYFFVPSFDQIIPTDSVAPNSPLPLRKVNELLRSDDTASTLVRVEGVVTQRDGNDFYLRDESGSVMVRTAGKDSLVPGDRVVAEGFAAIAPFRPVLRARNIVVTGHVGVPQPMTLDFSTTKLPLFQAELIELEADYLARHDGSREVALQCRLGDRFFEALLPPGGTLPQGIASGDRVKLTGICDLTTTHPLTVWWEVDGFRLHLPRTGGVIILRHAPWWTLKHVLALLGMVSGVAILALAWVWLLQCRVKKQTSIIVGQREQVAVRDERQRIARELHDTVEQELTGLSMQLGIISNDIMETPEQVPPRFHTAIQNAQIILRHCQNEARTSIRDLRSIELEHRGLAGALEELLPGAATGNGAAFQIHITGDPYQIDMITGNHLLRIAQEGVANAARHSGAREIAVNLDYKPDAITLAIRDDGCGFDPAAPPPDGHFGLHGLRERAHKIKAAIEIKSAPSEGTTIRIVVPLLKNQKTEKGN